MGMIKTTLSLSKSDKAKLKKIADANFRPISSQVSWWIAHDTTKIDSKPQPKKPKS